MTADDVLAEFRAAKRTLREGHFILSSGLHSPVFLQKNLVFMRADRTERLCRALAEKLRLTAPEIDVVISPAVGAIIPGYEITARWLGVPALYVERGRGRLPGRLRRGFGGRARPARGHGRGHRHHGPVVARVHQGHPGRGR